MKQTLIGILLWVFFFGNAAHAQIAQPVETPFFLAIVNLITAMLLFLFGLDFLRGVFEKLTCGGIEALATAAHKRLLKSIVYVLLILGLYYLILFIATFF